MMSVPSIANGLIVPACLAAFRCATAAMAGSLIIVIGEVG
jgi:hypothetical protein